MWNSLRNFSVGVVILAVVVGVIVLDGCADPNFALTKDIATGQCITATTGSLSVTSAAGGTIFAKQADTLVFCPPAIVANVVSVPTSPQVAASAAK